MWRSNSRNNRGDTIVEVLIALAVLSTILIGAYLTAQRAQNGSRATQERSEAVKLVESQIERLRGLLYGNTTATAPVGPFCINPTTNQMVSITAANSPFTQSLEADSLPYPDGCGDISGRYNVAIVGSGDTYQLMVRWERVGGGARDQINMYYRVH